MTDELQADQVDIPLEITARLEYVARQKLKFHDCKGNGVYDSQKQRELQQYGTRVLKWALLGCWNKGEKSLDEMVRAMMKIGAAGTVDEATALTEQLARGRRLELGSKYRYRCSMGHVENYGRHIAVSKQSDGTYKVKIDSHRIK